MDEEEAKAEAKLRAEALAAHDHMNRSLETARQLPPLWQASKWGLCETCGVERTGVCKRIEGREVLICGKCALKEMDEWEASS